MPTEQTEQNKVRGILTKVIGGIVITAGIIAGSFYVYLYFYVNNEIPETTVDTPIVQENPPEKLRIFTEEEKLKILEGLSVTNTKTISVKEKLKILLLLLPHRL